MTQERVWTEEESSIYLWVMEAVRSGILYDVQNCCPRNSIDLTDDVLAKDIYIKEFFRQFGRAVASAYGHDSEEAKSARARQIFLAAVGKKAEGGMPVRDDSEYLEEMFLKVNGGGMPIEYLYKAELWETLEAPDIEFVPLAREIIGGTRLYSELNSAARRLAGKFKSEYKLIAARYILHEQLLARVAQTMGEVHDVLRRNDIPFRL